MPPPKTYREQVNTVTGYQYTGSNAQELIDFGAGNVFWEEEKLVLRHPDQKTEVIDNTAWLMQDQWGHYQINTDYEFQIKYMPGGGPVDAQGTAPTG